MAWSSLSPPRETKRGRAATVERRAGVDLGAGLVDDAAVDA